MSSSVSLGCGGFEGRTLAMATIQEIVESVAELEAGRVTVEDFEDWSAELSWNAHHAENQAVRDLLYEIRAILNRHEEDHNDQPLRLELAKAVRPFARPYRPCIA